MAPARDDEPPPNSKAPIALGPGDETIARTPDTAVRREASRRDTSYRMLREPRDEEETLPPSPAAETGATEAQRPSGLVLTTLPRAEDPPTPTHDGYAPGDVIAQRYRLVEQIGSGGMGHVWRARNLGLDLDVALKLIRHDSVVPRAGERLFKEARAAARVVHPSAVRVFELGVTVTGDPFIAMEHLRGEALSSRLASVGRFPAREAVRLLLPILGALAIAHREGIVHRDVKPANVVLIEEGRCTRPVLIDFGIVGTGANVWSEKLTSQGMMVGSPIYMAPEQLFGSGVGANPRIDVWGVCLTLYELVTGERPFNGEDSATIINRVMTSAVPRHAAFASEPELFAIVRRGMAKLAGDRYPDAGALGRVLAAWARRKGEISDASGNALEARWDPPDDEG